VRQEDSMMNLLWLLLGCGAVVLVTLAIASRYG
jgi:hypothetical protein